MLRNLADLARVFATLSLISIGGGSAVIAEMQRQVIAHNWVTPREFLDFYAIARSAPGPGMQLVTLIGWRVAGWAGALVASVAMFLPSGLLVYLVTTVWGRLPESRWKQAITKGLAPLAVGLTLASVVTLLRSADHPLVAAATSLVCALALMSTKVSPLLLLALIGAAYVVAG